MGFHGYPLLEYDSTGAVIQCLLLYTFYTIYILRSPEKILDSFIRIAFISLFN